MQGHAGMVSLVEGFGFRVGGKYLVWPGPKLIGMQANAGKQVMHTCPHHPCRFHLGLYSGP